MSPLRDRAYPSIRIHKFWQIRRELVPFVYQYEGSDNFPINEILTFPYLAQIVSYNDTPSGRGLMQKTSFWKIRVEIPQNINFDENAFPVLKVVSEEDLLVFADDEVQWWELDRRHSASDREKSSILRKALDGVGDVSLSDVEKTCITHCYHLKSASQNVVKVAEIYRRYSIYRSEFINAYSLYRKIDEFGGEHLERVMKEFIRIARRNGIDDALGIYATGYGGDLVPDLTEESLLGFIALDMNDHNGREVINDGRQFEQRCHEILRTAGFDARLTSVTGDFGADIIAEKDGLSYVVQCKWSKKAAGIKAVQEAFSARSQYRVDGAVVVTNMDFTSAARELAVETKVMLLTVDQLHRLGDLWFV